MRKDWWNVQPFGFTEKEQIVYLHLMQGTTPPFGRQQHKFTLLELSKLIKTSKVLKILQNIPLLRAFGKTKSAPHDGGRLLLGWGVGKNFIRAVHGDENTAIDPGDAMASVGVLKPVKSRASVGDGGGGGGAPPPQGGPLWAGPFRAPPGPFMGGGAPPGPFRGGGGGGGGGRGGGGGGGGLGSSSIATGIKSVALTLSAHFVYGQHDDADDTDSMDLGDEHGADGASLANTHAKAKGAGLKKAKRATLKKAKATAPAKVKATAPAKVKGTALANAAQTSIFLPVPPVSSHTLVHWTCALENCFDSKFVSHTPALHAADSATRNLHIIPCYAVA